jgi:hypothetical protein
MKFNDFSTSYKIISFGEGTVFRGVCFKGGVVNRN